MIKILKFVRTNYELKLVFALILLIIGFFVFKAYIDTFIENTLVRIFKNSHISKPIEIILFVSSLLIIFYQLIKIVTGFIENRIKISFFILAGVIYLSYRLSGEYNFWEYSFINNIAYLDLIVFLSSSHIVLLGISIYKQLIFKSTNKTDFNDVPIQDSDSDVLNRNDAALSIANRIYDMDLSSSNSIGLIGSWGEGKTSILNLICQHLKKKKKATVIHFNPWRNINNKNIQSIFFTTLKENLKPFSSEIYPVINKYVDYLSQHDKTKASKYLMSFHQEQTEVLKEYVNVNKAIKRINRKIIIVIDDIDRLDKNEIFEVIKIIRNTGNFNNTLFVAAYDKSYVNKALEDFTKYKHDIFLEKIFQQEITLPSFPYSILSDSLINNLKQYYDFDKKISLEIESKIKFEPDDYNMVLVWDGAISSKAKNFLANIRDIKRFANSFKHSFTPIRDDVELIDFFHLEILKLKAYDVYIAIKEKKVLTFSIDKWDTYKLDENKFDEFIKKTSINEKEDVKAIVKTMFPDSKSSCDPKAIRNQKVFPIYFSNQLFNRLSRSDFNKLMTLDKDGLTNNIDKYLGNGFAADLIEYISTYPITSLSNDKEVLNYLDIWFLLLDKGYDVNIFNLISIFEPDNIKEITDKFFGGDKSKMTDYFIKQIEEASSPYHIRKVIYKLIGNYQYNANYKFFISQDDLKQFALTLLDKFLSNNDDLNIDGMWLYYTCVDHIDSNRRVHLMKEANEKMKKYITEEKHYKFYLDDFIRPQFTPDDGHNRAFEPFVSSIFGSFDNFELFINREDIKHPKLEIIRSFYSKLKSNNYQPVYYENPSKELKEKSG